MESSVFLEYVSGGKDSLFYKDIQTMNSIYPISERQYGIDPVLDNYQVALSQLRHYEGFDWPESQRKKQIVLMEQLQRSISDHQQRRYHQMKTGRIYKMTKPVNMYQSIGREVLK